MQEKIRGNGMWGRDSGDRHDKENENGAREARLEEKIADNEKSNEKGEKPSILHLQTAREQEIRDEHPIIQRDQENGRFRDH